MFRRFVLGVILLLLSTAGVAVSPALAASPSIAPAPTGTMTIATASTTLASPAPAGSPHLMPNQQAVARFAPSTVSNVTDHGGRTMHSPIVYLIYWLPTGLHFEPAGTATSDTNYESLVKGFFTDLNGSPFYESLSQYTDRPPMNAPAIAGGSGPVLNSALGPLTVGGTWGDTSAYGHTGSSTDPLHDSDIQSEVTRAMTQNNWTPGPNTEFFVYTALNINSCSDLSNKFCTFSTPTSGGYCAYHWDYSASFSTNNATVLYANMGDMQSGCTVSGASPHSDITADSVISVTSHEFFESVSDPLLNAWFDGTTGGEIGDKCAWVFGERDPHGSDVELKPLLTSDYIVQQEWSNRSSGCELQLPPTVASVTANAGPATGGGTVTIHGTGLLGVAGQMLFSFGPYAVTSTGACSATQCVLDVPTAQSVSFCQPVDVTATVTGLQSSHTTADKYDYYAAWPLTPIESARACVDATHSAL